MPLLIRTAAISERDTDIIYIPLCLYLYCDAEKAYPSITDLHSTMPLLIPVMTKLQIISRLIYIPLCLYLYYRVAGFNLIKN